MGDRTRPIGRFLRLIIGAALLLMALQFILRASAGFLARTFVLVLALSFFYAVVHYLVSNYLQNLNVWLGAVLPNLPVIVMFVLGISGGLLFGSGEGQLAIFTYLGLVLLIAGLRADPGCEVMAIPGLIFGSQTHLACIAFSPIDWIEAKLSGKR